MIAGCIAGGWLNRLCLVVTTLLLAKQPGDRALLDRRLAQVERFAGGAIMLDFRMQP